jgi:hypothetical protein
VFFFSYSFPSFLLRLFLQNFSQFFSKRWYKVDQGCPLLQETTLRKVGACWYENFDRRFLVFRFKDLRLIGRCLWFITMKQCKQTKTREPDCWSVDLFWTDQKAQKNVNLSYFQGKSVLSKIRTRKRKRERFRKRERYRKRERNRRRNRTRFVLILTWEKQNQQNWIVNCELMINCELNCDLIVLFTWIVCWTCP